MAFITDEMKFNPKEQSVLDEIKRKAKVLHEKNRITARRAGIYNFPDFPFECSAAFELQYLRGLGHITRENEIRRGQILASYSS